jgi:hypothetical protein
MTPSTKDHNVLLTEINGSLMESIIITVFSHSVTQVVGRGGTLAYRRAQ